MSDLDDAKQTVSRLQTQADLQRQLDAAGAAYESDPTPENLAAHNAAAEDLVAHRATYRTVGGLTVGGDAVPDTTPDALPTEEG